MSYAQQKPLIGVNMHLTEAVMDRPQRKVLQSEIVWIQTAYLEPLREAGAEVVLLPPGDHSAPSILPVLDGIVLIGGNDYDPEQQGCARTSWNTRLMAPARERSDRQLLSAARASKLPVLAIGAGMQLLNVVCGGTLSYEISEDFRRSMPHHERGDVVRHGIELQDETGSLMERVFNDSDACGFTGELGITSQHHQAVDDVAPNFRVTARASDGVIEAIESTNPDWFAVGVQFHPEAAKASRLERLVFERWLEMLSGRKQTRELAFANREVML
jgi:putative glutamine amidotransferase